MEGKSLAYYRKHIVCIPIDIVRFVVQHKMAKAFELFIFLKCHSSGKVHKDSSLFQSISGALGIRDPRTIKSYLGVLLHLNWIGFNAASGYYFIRGFNYIRKAHQFKSRKAAIFDYRQIDVLAGCFLPGALICEQIKAQQYYWEVSPKRRAKFATKILGVANQNFPASTTSERPPFYGLSNKRIAELLFCKMTRACELKQQAEDGGYLKTKKRFKEITRLSKPDFTIRKAILQNHPELGKRVRFRARNIGRHTVIEVLQQMHDEIVPLVEFKNIKRFNRIQQKQRG
jgi:hypothetical protein